MSPYRSTSTATRSATAITARLEGVDVDAGADARRTTRYLYMDRDRSAGREVLRAARAARRSTAACGSSTRARARRSGSRAPTAIDRAGEGPRGAVRDRARRRRARPARAAADRVGAPRLRREHARARPPARRRCRARPTRRAAPKPSDGADAPRSSGELDNYWDRPYDGAWNLALDAQEPRPDGAHAASSRRSAATTSTARSR